MNEYESAALWKIYLNNDEGIAVQSTFKRLAGSFSDYSGDDVFIGKVKYADYNVNWIPEGYTFCPFLHKRRSFEHEKELRVIIQRIPTRQGSNKEHEEVDLKKEICDIEIYVPIDLNTLVERIFVSPTAQTWFSDLVKAIVARYSLDKPVSRSSLAEDPVY
jgi:hypothetical protein